jgi:hypothetical protein
MSWLDQPLIKERVIVKKISGLLLTGAFLVQAGIAAPGEGIKVGEFTLSPYVAPAYKHDSNVALSDSNEQDDDVTSIRYGATLVRQSDQSTFDLRLGALSEDYSDFDGRDHDDVMQSLLLGMITDGGTDISVMQSYSKVEDIDFALGQIQEFETSLVEAKVTRRVTDKIFLGLGYKFDQRDFQNPSLFDWDSNVGAARIGYAYTDKSVLFVQGRFGVLSSDGNADDGNYYNAVAGIRSEGTDKITYSVAVGGLGVSDDNISEDISDVAYNGSLQWTATDKVNVNLTALRSVTPSSLQRNNYDLTSSYGGNVSCQLTDSIKGSVGVTFVNVDLQEPYTGAGASQDKEEDITVSRVRVDYQAPAEFLSIFAEGSFTDQDSSIAGADYKRDLISIGAQLKY